MRPYSADDDVRKCTAHIRVPRRRALEARATPAITRSADNDLMRIVIALMICIAHRTARGMYAQGASAEHERQHKPRAYTGAEGADNNDTRIYASTYTNIAEENISADDSAFYLCAEEYLFPRAYV